jgi:hypothetical protein
MFFSDLSRELPIPSGIGFPHPFSGNPEIKKYFVSAEVGLGEYFLFHDCHFINQV